MNSQISDLYFKHHRQSAAFRNSVNLEIRGPIFKTWVGENKSVIDLGCRNGLLTRHYTQGNRVIGCDIDAEALLAAQSSLGIETHALNLNEKLPFADAQSDVVVAAEVLEHLPYWDISLTEICRILKPNGILVGSIPLSFHLNDRWRVLRGKPLVSMNDRTHVRFVSFDGFQQELRRFGMEMKGHVVLEGGGSLRSRFPKLFARNIAFFAAKRP